jgi:hypothetical protein
LLLGSCGDLRKNSTISRKIEIEVPHLPQCHPNLYSTRIFHFPIFNDFQTFVVKRKELAKSIKITVKKAKEKREKFHSL